MDLLSLTEEVAEVKAGLFDTFDWDAPMIGRTVAFTTATQTVTATVDADGIATAQLLLAPGQSITVASAFVGDGLYHSARDTNVMTVARTIPPAEIVFMIDESSSMENDHAEVKDRLNAITAQLTAALDFRMGLVGFGGPTLGGQARIHTPLTDDITVFANALDKLVVTGGTEAGFNGTVVGMSDAMGFRTNAGVCTIIITDEDGSENINTNAPETKADALAALNDRNAVFLGIINPPYLASSDDYGPNPGSLAAETGGEVFNILDFRANPGPVLASIIERCIQEIIARIPPDLSVTKTDGQTIVAPGQHLTYTLTISNTRIQAASGVAITDTLPAHTTFLSASDNGGHTSGLVTWPAFSLAPFASVTRTVTVQVDGTIPPGVGVLTNTVTVTDDGSNGSDPTPDNNTAHDVNIVDAAPDLTVAKGDGQTSVLPGQTLTYTLTISNAGNQDATTVHITDTLPSEGITFVSASDGGSVTGDTVTWPTIDLAAGAGVTRMVVVQVDDPLPVGAAAITNTVTVADDGINGPDPTPDNNAASDVDHVFAVTDLAVTKEGAPDPVIAGSSLTYTIVVTNGGPAAASGVRVTDTLPTVVAIGSVTPNQGSCQVSASVTCDLGPLDSGDTTTVTIIVMPTSAGILTNTVTVDGNELDLDDANNRALAATTVSLANLPPTANDQMAETLEDTPVDIVLTASDPDGDPLSFTVVADPISGTLSGVVPNLTYTPNADYNGPDRFTFLVNDGTADSNIASVSITVNPVNDDPIAEDDQAKTPEDLDVVIDVLANDIDIDNDVLTVTKVSLPHNGVAIIRSDNRIIYTPKLDFNGSDVFSYTISDGNGGIAAAAVTITVIPVNDPPVALDDAVTTPGNVAVTIDVLANDSDAEQDVLTVISVTQPLSGTVVVSPGGSVIYTPGNDFHRMDQFRYGISDGNGGTAEANVTVTVQLQSAWRYVCNDPSRLRVDVVGAGMGNRNVVEQNPQTLTIDNPQNVAFIVIQVVVESYRNVPKPERVIIRTDTETHELLDPTNTEADYHYEVTLQPTSQISAEVIGVGRRNRKTPHAVTAYIFRRNSDDVAHTGRLVHAEIRRGNHKETFTIPAMPFARDVSLTYVIADMTNDSRSAVLQAQAGNIAHEVTVSRPNRGDELLIERLVLRNVPGDVTDLAAKVISPVQNGDSLVWSGVDVAMSCVLRPSQIRVTRGLQVLYTFKEGDGSTVHDVAGAGSPLDLTIEDTDAISWLPNGGLVVHSPTILASTAKATRLNHAARATRELTIEAWVKPANTLQRGPARIVSLSQNILNRNFTLGQVLDRYNIRLRTTRTDNNGRPSVSTPKGRLTSTLTHVVYTRDKGGVVRIYIDGIELPKATIQGDFSNWENRYRIILANELSRNRPWLGEYHLVAIYNRALRPAEVLQNFFAQ